MAIGYLEQDAVNVPTPPIGSVYTFFDNADGNFKKKDENGVVTNLGASAGSVDSVFGRVGAVVSVNGDYTASQVTNVPSGGIAATNVQAAIDELSGEKLSQTHEGQGGAVHAAVTTLANGFMIASDKSKLDGISSGANAGITALTGEVTASGIGSVAATLSNAAVIGQVLTGFSGSTGAVDSTDSILTAIQKLSGGNSIVRNLVDYSVTVPTDHTWTRQNRTRFEGLITITLSGTATLKISA